MLQETKLSSQIERFPSDTIVSHLPGDGKFKSLDHTKVGQKDRYKIIGILFWGMCQNARSKEFSLQVVCLPSENAGDVLEEIADMKVPVNETKIILLASIIQVVKNLRRFPTVKELYESAIPFKTYLES